MKYWQKSLALNPRLADAYNSMGTVALRRGDQEEAVRLLGNVIEIDPRFPGVRGPLAGELLALGRPEQAVAVLQEGARLVPFGFQGHYLLGEAHAQLNDYPKAIEHYRQAIDVRPDHTPSYYGLATACLRLGRTDEAQGHMAEFKQLRTRDSKAVANRIKAYDDLEEKRLDLAQTHATAGKICHRHGNARKAEEHWRRAAALDPKQIECREDLAALLRADGRRDEALRVCEQLGEIAPDDARVHLHIGILNLELERFDAALAAAERAIELDPNDARYRQFYEQIKRSQ